MGKFRGKESLFREETPGFKKPSRPGNRPDEPPRNRKVPYEDRGSRGRRGGKNAPDFRVNPEKYTKYSLADVDLPTNNSNSQAAFAFLDEVKKRKSGESTDEVKVQEGAKFTFKKPTKKHASREKADDEMTEEAAAEDGDKVAADEGGS